MPTSVKNLAATNIKSLSSWIKKNKEVLNPELTNSTQNVDVNILNDMKKHAYDIITAHSSEPCPKEPLLVILIGVGGTGKSYLIHAIRNFLQHSCAITSTTGKASYNIRECTIHSLLKLPFGSKGNKEVTGQSLFRLQSFLKDIRYILIDEYSMLGQSMLGWIDKRCRQATGLTDELFGGKSIILVAW